MNTRKYLLIILAMSLLMSALPVDLSAQDQRLGKHRVSEWRAKIDSLWGPGSPTETKLRIFDFYWDLIDKQSAEFPNLTVNWDSMRTHYRPEVEAGVSRGRFAAIMGQMHLSLQDIHTWIIDAPLASPGSGDPRLSRGYSPPGTPVFWPSGWGSCGVFGAALTPLPDSSLLVYKAIVPHPLGLVPGDVILGYDNVPWRRLYKEALALGFPLAWMRGGVGTTPRSMAHMLLSSAGNNWGLFDTVDVVKYATGDTAHLSTAPLTGLAWDRLQSSDQLPVPGVRMPAGEAVPGAGVDVTYGVVEGTTIGYVYVRQWSNKDGPPFRAALNDLLSVRKVTGLVLDFRLNYGGDVDNAANAGFDLLFNETPAGAARWRSAMRVYGTDRFQFDFSDPFDCNWRMQPDYYDRPIAVLTGPGSMSMADMHAFRLRFHPMVRFFGLPTNGAFCVPNNIPTKHEIPGAPEWWYMWPRGQMVSQVNNEGFLMHKGFPVDEEVWLTREGAAKGEDDVVKRALAWISSLSYAHTARLTQLSRDTVGITARVENPLSHALAVTATLSDDGGRVIDSLVLNDDGRHGDGAAGDSLWGALYVPAVDGPLLVSLRTEDRATGTARTLPKAAQLLFTRGPRLAVDTRDLDFGPLGSIPCDSAFLVWNRGYERDSLAVTVDYITVSPDSALAVIPTAFGLAPGDSQRITIKVRPALLTVPGYYNAQLNVTSFLGYGQPAFAKVIIFKKVTSGVGERPPLPIAFALEQNYPNPFNPTTTIRYGLPHRSHVRLAVFNTLAQEVAELVNGEIEPGYHEVQFSASSLASGVYFYRLQAGSFVNVKKLLLAR